MLLIAGGIAVCFIGAMCSDMDDSITEKQTVDKGIYSWVRNPLYSVCGIALSGGLLMWHNVWLLMFPVIDWL